MAMQHSTVHTRAFPREDTLLDTNTLQIVPRLRRQVKMQGTPVIKTIGIVACSVKVAIFDSSSLVSQHRIHSKSLKCRRLAQIRPAAWRPRRQ